MVTMNLQIGLEMRYICVQCGQDMTLEKQTAPTQLPTLKCPQCGHRVKIQMGAKAQPLPGLGQLMPAFRPHPKA